MGVLWPSTQTSYLDPNGTDVHYAGDMSSANFGLSNDLSVAGAGADYATAHHKFFWKISKEGDC